MRIVVNHLTRMKRGYMCVAGVDIDTGYHVRPVSVGGRLSTNLLVRNNGPFDMGVVLDLGTPRSFQRRPEVEDHVVDPSKVRAIGTFRASRFWKLLTQISELKLLNIFGTDLVAIGSSSCGVEVGKGRASLGCLIPKLYPDLYIRRRSDRADQVRMRLSDGDFYLDCGVTDIRLYGDDYITPDERLVQRIAERLQSDVEIVLSMGLTRAYASKADFDPVHWLQVNNIHLQDDPTWQLG
jgi:hypothetical protein